MNTEYFILYLAYGFAMINMGIFCLKEKDSALLDLPIVKSLKYLGYFGIIHGITEWIQMLSIVEVYPNFYETLYNVNLILKGISFAYLLYFGLDLLPIRSLIKRRLLWIPSLLCGLFIVGYVGLISLYGPGYHLEHEVYSAVMMRYILAISSGIMTSIALFENAKIIRKRKPLKVARRYQSLGWIFLIYGLLEGLLVKQDVYFPANIINREMFHAIVGFPTLFLKASVGLIINFLLSKVLETFRWEQEGKLARLEKDRIASEERRKLGLEIHDSIIQGMYAVGLKVEYLSIKSTDESSKDMLGHIKSELNDTIDKTREFISSSTLEMTSLAEIKENLEELINKYDILNRINIDVEYKDAEDHRPISSEWLTQLYYILQEGICNVVKHSEATRADVKIASSSEGVYATIADDGIGISKKDIDKAKHFGIQSMKERSERLGGSFQIEKAKKGTLIRVLIPWEGQDA